MLKYGVNQLNNKFKQLETEITQFISSFVKGNLGKGPTDTQIKIADDVLVFIIEGILTPVEQNIIKEGGESIVLEGRRLSTKRVNKIRISGLEKIVQLKAVKHFETWNLE